MARRELWQVSRNMSDSDNRIFVAMRPEKQAFGLRFWVLFCAPCTADCQKLLLTFKPFKLRIRQCQPSERCFPRILDDLMEIPTYSIQELLSGGARTDTHLEGEIPSSVLKLPKNSGYQLGGPSSTGFKGDTGRNDAQLFVGI